VALSRRGLDLCADLFGAFIPFQVVLLPMARTLGQLGLAGSVTGLVLVHTVYGLAFTTLFFRNFFVDPARRHRAGRQDRRRRLLDRIFFRIMLPMSIPAIVVTVIWQFTQIWNDFLFGVAFIHRRSAAR
jgi:glucose/mannose transport system permease protein